MRTQSDADLRAAPPGVDLVVPAVGIELPVLLFMVLALVDVIHAEIVLSAHKLIELIDTAAFVRGALSICHVFDSTDVTHGSSRSVTSFVFV